MPLSDLAIWAAQKKQVDFLTDSHGATASNCDGFIRLQETREPEALMVDYPGPVFQNGEVGVFFVWLERS